MKELAILFATCALNTGCASISNVTNDPDFAGFVKSEITLKKQVLVCKDDPLKTEDGSSIDYKLIYNINLITKCPFGETVGLLPEGSKIHVDEIEKHNIVNVKNTTHIYFLGNSKMPNGEPFKFYYLYGHEGYYENQPW